MEMKTSDPPSYEEVLNASKLDNAIYLQSSPSYIQAKLWEFKPQPHPYRVNNEGSDQHWQLKQVEIVEDKGTFWKFIIVTVIVLILMLVVFKVVYCET